jgi:hypothetical protein
MAVNENVWEQIAWETIWNGEILINVRLDVVVMQFIKHYIDFRSKTE